MRQARFPRVRSRRDLRDPRIFLFAPLRGHPRFQALLARMNAG